MIRVDRQIFKRAALMAAMLGTLSSCAWLDHKQGEWIWSPAQTTWWGFKPDVHKFEELYIPVGNEGEKIHAWWVPAETTKPDEAPTLLFLHGRRWNLTGSATRIMRFRNMGYNVLAIDYRGFGQSSGGTPSEAKAYEDATAAWEWIKQREPNPAKRFVAGHSLGGAVAIHLAADRSKQNDHPATVMVESTFTSMADMAKQTAARFLPVNLILRQRFDSIAKVPEVKSPIVFVHGTNDALVPAEMSERLYQAAKSPKRLILVEGATHHAAGAQAGERYSQAIRELLTESAFSFGSSQATFGQ